MDTAECLQPSVSVIVELIPMHGNSHIILVTVAQKLMYFDVCSSVSMRQEL
jgi:hypothetical protein